MADVMQGYKIMKTKKSNKILFLFLFLAVISIGGTAFGQYRKQVKAKDSEEELVIGENQKLVDGVIESIIGNEMVLEDGEVQIIPVGTQVETKLGAVTTFSRLNAKDGIQMLVEDVDGEEVILKIWIAN